MLYYIEIVYMYFSVKTSNNLTKAGDTMAAINTSEIIHNLCGNLAEQNSKPFPFSENDSIKRGLRNADGTGVMVGYTGVGSVLGYSVLDGERIPMEGRLMYRGYDLADLVKAFSEEKRFGYIETAYLLLFGKLPTKDELKQFNLLVHELMPLPDNFTEDMILKNPSHDIMNKLGRSVLALYSSDPNADDLSLENLIRQSVSLIARFPVIVSHAYVVKRHYFDHKSLYLHRPVPALSNAENILRMIRPFKQYTEDEARLLDFCLVCHADHGGGNNSTFTCRSVSSTGSDTYSAIAAAVGSLKGPLHGGANLRVMAQLEEIKRNVRVWTDDGELSGYLRKILRKQAGDGSGLIYGMGHAIYTLSDPRTLILKEKARSVAEEKGYLPELQLLEAIERLTPQLFAEETGKEKIMCANVDMYSGLIYKILDIPPELYTPLFAVARISGWCAHRIEQIIKDGRIYRPAFKSIVTHKNYVPLSERK